jgi:hypothetical protein
MTLAGLLSKTTELEAKYYELQARYQELIHEYEQLSNFVDTYDPRLLSDYHDFCFRKQSENRN